MLFRVVVGGATAALGLATWSHSRWGPMAKASVKEFHRSSYNRPPPDWSGPTFKPRLDYPRAARSSLSSSLSSVEKPPPWSKIDFKREPEKYMQAVLEYCFEGNVENDFVPQRNPTRNWYHAPWMCQTAIGREPIHGLTYERPAPERYLADTQKRVCQSWAVAMYNEQGSYAFGEMWNKWGQPLSKHTKFPTDSVSFKLLFTEATPEDIPFLEGSPSWKATIAKNAVSEKTKGPSSERTTVPVDLHFLQVDIAVRDTRADDTTGWVFGTFMYHDSIPNDNPWKRLIPVCLMWGNDPELTEEKYNKGDRPKESWINPKVAEMLPKTRPYFGWLGRGNGPIDNFKSSCVSCHSTASHPHQPAMYKENKTKGHVMDWFRNVKSGEKFKPEVKYTLDYSLQMSAGFENYHNWQQQWRPLPILPLYQDKKGLPVTSPKNMLNARGFDFADYPTSQTEDTTDTEKKS